MRAEERSEISLLKKEKMNLLKLIDKKNEEKISLQSEVKGDSVVTNSLNPCHPRVALGLGRRGNPLTPATLLPGMTY